MSCPSWQVFATTLHPTGQRSVIEGLGPHVHANISRKRKPVWGAPVFLRSSCQDCLILFDFVRALHESWISILQFGRCCCSWFCSLHNPAVLLHDQRNSNSSGCACIQGDADSKLSVKQWAPKPKWHPSLRTLRNCIGGKSWLSSDDSALEGTTLMIGHSWRFCNSWLIWTRHETVVHSRSGIGLVRKSKETDAYSERLSEKWQMPGRGRCTGLTPAKSESYPNAGPAPLTGLHITL